MDFAVDLVYVRKMRIVWDEPKRRTNLVKHGLDFADLSIEFFLSARIEPARRGRMVAIGRLGDRTVVVSVFRPLGTEALSVISLRRAGRKERSKLHD